MPVSRIKAPLANPVAIAVVAPLVALSGVSAAARDKTCAPEHNEAVVDALNQFFEAASHDDDKLFTEVLAPNFYAFDNGKRFDGMQRRSRCRQNLRLDGQRPGSSHCLRLGVGHLNSLVGLLISRYLFHARGCRQFLI